MNSNPTPRSPILRVGSRKISQRLSCTVLSLKTFWSKFNTNQYLGITEEELWSSYLASLSKNWLLLCRLASFNNNYCKWDGAKDRFHLWAVVDRYYSLFQLLKIIYLTSPWPFFLPTSLLSQKSSLLLPGGFEWGSKLSFPSKTQEMFLLISEIIWSPHQYQCWATYVCYRGNLGYFLSSTHRLIDNSYSACNISKEITVFCAAKRESLTNMFNSRPLLVPLLILFQDLQVKLAQITSCVFWNQASLGPRMPLQNICHAGCPLKWGW